MRLLYSVFEERPWALPLSHPTMVLDTSIRVSSKGSVEKGRVSAAMLVVAVCTLAGKDCVAANRPRVPVGPLLVSYTSFPGGVVVLVTVCKSECGVTSLLSGSVLLFQAPTGFGIDDRESS